MKAREFAAEREDARREFAATVPEWGSMPAEEQDRALSIHMGIVWNLVAGSPEHDGSEPRGFLSEGGQR